MKKLIIFIFVTTLIYCNDKALIASFNTLHLGWNGKDYYEQAEVISNFDIVALQEVMKEKGLEELVSNLENITNEPWEYHMSPESYGNNSYREHYAFIYKKEKVNFIRSLGTYPETNNEFIREPYGAMFRINNFDFIMVSQHSIFGKRKSDRRSEASQLVNVYNYFQDMDPNEQDVFLVGDYNLPASDKGFSDLLNHYDEIYYAINPDFPTTIGKTSLTSSYDNIFYSYIYTDEYTGAYGIFNFTESEKYINKYHDDRFRILRKTLSDHLPVYIEVNTAVDDD